MTVRLEDYTASPEGELPDPGRESSGLALVAEREAPGRVRVRVACRLPETVRNHFPAVVDALVLHVTGGAGDFAASLKLRDPDADPGEYVPNYVAAPTRPGHPLNAVRLALGFTVVVDEPPAGPLHLHLSLLDRLSPVVALAPAAS